MKRSLICISLLSILFLLPNPVHAALPVTPAGCVVDAIVPSSGDVADQTNTDVMVNGHCDPVSLCDAAHYPNCKIRFDSGSGSYTESVITNDANGYWSIRHISTLTQLQPDGSYLPESWTISLFILGNPVFQTTLLISPPPNITDEDLTVTGGRAGQIINPVLTKIFGQTDSVNGGAPILQVLLRNAIILALGIGGLIFVFNIIRGGYIFLTSGADKEAHQKAAKLLTQGTVGLALLLSLFAIIYLLNIVLGINIYNLTIGSIA